MSTQIITIKTLSKVFKRNLVLNKKPNLHVCLVRNSINRVAIKKRFMFNVTRSTEISKVKILGEAITSRISKRGMASIVVKWRTDGTINQKFFRAGGQDHYGILDKIVQTQEGTAQSAFVCTSSKTSHLQDKRVTETVKVSDVNLMGQAKEQMGNWLDEFPKAITHADFLEQGTVVRDTYDHEDRVFQAGLRNQSENRNTIFKTTNKELTKNFDNRLESNTKTQADTTKKDAEVIPEKPILKDVETIPEKPILKEDNTDILKDNAQVLKDKAPVLKDSVQVLKDNADTFKINKVNNIPEKESLADKAKAAVKPHNKSGKSPISNFIKQDLEQYATKGMPLEKEKVKPAKKPMPDISKEKVKPAEKAMPDKPSIEKAKNSPHQPFKKKPTNNNLDNSKNKDNTPNAISKKSDFFD